MSPAAPDRRVRPVELVAPEELGPVHFVAAGGAGMSGVAELYVERGISVSGSDRADSAELARLADLGVRTHVGHAAEQLGEAATVVVSSAIAADNPELVAARERGLRVWHRSAALAALMLGRRGVAVSGTAGKTTTTAMVAEVLLAAGRDPGYVVGARLIGSGRSAAPGAGELMVVEADESDGSFLQYPAEVVVVTCVGSDHLDVWGSPEAYARGFEELVGRPGVQTVVLCADDPGCERLAAHLATLGEGGPELVLYGESALADLVLSELVVDGTTTRARLVWRGSDTGELVVSLPGRHYALDAAAAYAVARVLGVEHQPALLGLAGFTGTARRFERHGEADGVLVVDDYAHHPDKVAAALASARAAADGGRVLVCFQPHLFSRTRDFAAEFGTALAGADEVVLLEIYPAREAPLPGVTAELVREAVAVHLDPDRVRVLEPEQAVARLVERARPGDLVMTVGAGDVTRLAPRLLAALDARSDGEKSSGEVGTR